MSARKSLDGLLVVFLAVAAAGMMQSQDGEPPSATEVTPDPWPKSANAGGAAYTLYHPQLDSWDGYQIAVRAAASVLPAGAKDPVFGVLEITAVTSVDRIARVVSFESIAVRKATFPSAPQTAGAYQAEFQSILRQGPATMSLDRLQASLAVVGARKTGRTIPVQNEPPAFVFTQDAAVLVSLSGPPVWTAAGKDLERVLNTRALVLRDKKGNLYLHLFDGFVEAKALGGPWKDAKHPPKGAAEVAQQLASQNLVDLMEGPPEGEKPSLKKGVPEVVVATTPTELIVTQGIPTWLPLEGTNLLYVANTTANLFKDLDDQQTYALVSGRWFRATGFTGPWQYVPGKDLPADFARIPDDSPKENVKASVPGTPQAEDGAIAAEIPQTARIERAKAQFQPKIDGAPRLKPITGTPLQYVYNSANPIIQVSPTQWYAVNNAVWFTAASMAGPWAVAGSVPAVIYSIPPSSPLYYVTYVQVYASTPDYVVAGYTPGYQGAIVTADGVVVYGTGYTYVPYIASTFWYPPPVTYGYAVNMTYTPWTGWAFGFGMGWAAASMAYPAYGWGCAPYYGAAYSGYAYGAYGGAAAWGPGGWAATTGNVYSHYGATSAVSRSSAGYNAWTGNAWSSKVGTSYNSVTGRASAGQSASVANAYTGGYAYGNRGATYNPTTGVAAEGGRATVGNAYTGQQATVGRATVSGPGGETAHVAQVNNNYYADHDGNVYRSQGDGSVQKYGGDGSWSDVDRGQMQSSMQSEEQARASGDARSAGSSWGGGGDWGGGFDHGGGGGSWGQSGRSWGGGGFGGGHWGGGGGFGGFRGRR